MARRSAIVVGSGAGGSVAAWALVEAGYEVLILEKGRDLLPGLGRAEGARSLFANDEVRSARFFENQDPLLEPRTGRSQADAAKGTARTFQGDINDLPTTVGGGTIHWDAKVPRFWRQDFKGLSLYGPVPGANVADWPLEYEDLAPYYDEVEARLGVQGDVAQMPARTREQAPRSRPFPQRPNPPMYAGLRLAEGAAALGHTAYPYPMAINSKEFDGRPRCNSCGFCSGFGCPINARGGAAVSFLHQAVRGGARLISRAFVSRIELSADGRRARGVSWLDPSGTSHTEHADTVVLAPSAIETARLARLSGLPDRSGQLGRNIMFHFFSEGFGIFAEELHAWRGPSSTFTLDDFVGPVRSPEVRAAGLPYVKGGICEVGGGLTLLSEAQLYTSVGGVFGTLLKELMRQSPFRRFAAGLSMVGEDLPQLANVVDLDPTVRDVHGLPVPRITHSAHRFEEVASLHYGPQLAAVCQASPGCIVSGFLPLGLLAEQSGGFSSPIAGQASTAHIMGTARMGYEPRTSVVDPWGRWHGVDNVHVADGSVFVSAGGFNPTLTIMALALRAARHLA